MKCLAKNRLQASRFKALAKGRLHPEYTDEAAMVIHMECRMLTAETGIKHEVDHIIPLKFGGWHHHKNLQCLPYFVNDEKHSDPFWQVDGYKSFMDVPTYLWPPLLAPSYFALIENLSKDSLTSSKL